MRIDPADLQVETRIAIKLLKRALAREAELLGFMHAQVTFDDVACTDAPPTVDVLGCPT
jgi:hypothetical protein